MRLYEFDGSAAGNSRLLTVLNHIRSKYKEKGQPPKIKMQSLINMVRNAGDQSFNYDSLVSAHDKDPAVKNLINNFNQDSVDLSTDIASDGDSGQDSEKTVDTMAKRALDIGK